MDLLLRLLLSVVLFAAGFEIWRSTVGYLSTVAVKLGLLRNIRMDAHTTLTITLSAMKISLWTQVLQFLRAPNTEKLLVIKFPSVHLLVATEPLSGPHPHPQKPSPPFWTNLDTTISLKNLQHPIWTSARVWIPRLYFLCKFVHAVQLEIENLAVEVAERRADKTVPVVNIQHGSISASALFHAKTEELECTVRLSQLQSTKIILPEIDASIVVGSTEICICVPISQDGEGVRAPVPMYYSFVCELVQVNLDLEALIATALSSKQQSQDCVPSVTLADDSFDRAEAMQAPTLLRLVELTPDNLRFIIRHLEANVVNKSREGEIDEKCSLILKNLGLSRCGTIDQEISVSETYSAVKRNVVLTLETLFVYITDAGNEVPPTIKLESLKIEVKGKASMRDDNYDTIDDEGHKDRHPLLCIKSTISGGSRGLEVTVTKAIQSWVASGCSLYDRVAIPNGQENPTAQGMVGNSPKQSCSEFWELDVDAYFKMVKTEVSFISLDRSCEILPKGVPSVCLTLGEVSIYGHPLMNEEQLGVRAKADIQCSRFKASIFSNRSSTKRPFLSLDFVRVFVCPIATMMQSEEPAEVEMEAEWVDVKWSPEMLHAIGGMVELGVFIMSPVLHESRHPSIQSDDANASYGAWKKAAALKVPEMRPMEDVVQDIISPGEVITFRCVAKRICVTFGYMYEGESQIDCVTVDTFVMSSERTTERLRISIHEAKAFQSQRPSGKMSVLDAKPSRNKTRFQRKSFMSRASRSRGPANCDPSGVQDCTAEYFFSDCFSLEENKVVGCTKSVVDLFVNGIRLEWDIVTQLRIMELVRRVTFSSWEMIYRIRSAYAIYCATSNSLYNRPYGLNPPLDDIDECLRYEKQFTGLISASGDKLHRLHSTNLEVNAKICDGIDLHITAGVFAGDDLPEIWVFQNVSLQFNELEMAVVSKVHVRHTTAKQDGYVFGEFEDMLRRRLSACKRSTTIFDQSLVDGIMVDISRLKVRTSRDFPFQAHLDAIQSAFEPYKKQMVFAIEQYWRPQQELFYQFFLRTPPVDHQKELWMRLEDIEFDCIGNPLDCWLERMYPIWMGELADQELRAQMLDDHATTLRLTNEQMFRDDSYHEMKTLLVEKNAKIYVQKVKRLQSEERLTGGGSLASVSVGRVTVDVAFEGDEKAAWTQIQALDEASGAIEKMFVEAGRNASQYVPRFQLFTGVSMKVAVMEPTVHIKRFPTPLMSCDYLGVNGKVFCTAITSGASILPFSLVGALRCFLDLAVDVTSPVVYFSPSYLYALNELAELAVGMLPLAVFDIDRHYQTSSMDILRRLVHGKMVVSVKDAAIRLLNAETSFEFTDYLEVVVHHIRGLYSSGSIDVEVTRVMAKIEPGGLANIAELSHLKLQVWMKWGCLGDPAMHYIYPIEFQGPEGDLLVLNASHAVDLTSSQEPVSSYNPLQTYQATELSVFVSGRICPVNPETADATNADGWSKRDMAARTAIVLYSKHVEWVIGFGRVYQKVPAYPLPRRRHDDSFTLPSLDLLGVLKGVTIEEFDFIGLDVALYASEKHPSGIRSFIDDKISCSGAFLRSSHETFRSVENRNSDSEPEVRRLSFTIDDVTWVIHNVTVVAQDIHARVCTRESGSRGESLVSVKHVSLIVGGGAESVPTHDNGVMKVYSPPPMHYGTNDQSTSESQTIGVKERPKTSILEYFDIPHDNPFCYRDSDSDAEGDTNELESESDPNVVQTAVVDEFRQLGFLLGLLSKEVRVTVTLTALESLVDIADTWYQVIVASVPELFDKIPENKASLETDEEESVAEESESSPKKFTSLAQDPKFIGLCLQGGSAAPRDESLRFEPTPFSNADTVRPSRRRSSVSTISSRAREAMDDKTLRSTSSKAVRAFLMVKFEDIQISVQDRQHKGSILLALNAGMLRHAVSTDASHERIDLTVDGLQLFTAPLDVDVKSTVVWLKALIDGSYCPSSYGLLKQVIAPIPVRVTLWVDKEKSLVKNKVRLAIPSIDVDVNPTSKDILENLTTSATALINSKLAKKQVPEHANFLHSYLKESKNQERSLHHLLGLKKQLKWKIAALQRRQLYGWDYRMNEHAVIAMSAAESARTLAFDVEMSPLFRRRRISSASVSSVATSISMLGSTATNRYEDDQVTEELQKCTQQFESLSQLTRLVANEMQRQQDKKNPLPNVDMEFTLDRASFMLSGDNVGIVRAQVGSLFAKMQLFEDHSGNAALTLRDLSANNLSPGTPYPDLLLPAFSRTWEGDDMFLRIDAEIAKPVRGVTVVQHFEVNVHPIQVCITQEVIIQLIAFFSPSTNVSTTKDEQREEVRSQFLQARTASFSTSDGRVGSAILKAVKVAGKAAAHPLSLTRNQRADSDEDLSSTNRKHQGSGLRSISEDPSQWLAKLVALSDSDEIPTLSSIDKQDANSAERVVDSELKDRTSSSILFKRIRLGAVEVVVTYKNKKSSTGTSGGHHIHLPHAPQPQALEDMRGFEVKTHALVYCDKTCSPMDLLLRIRRDILLDVLSQVGRNFTNIGNFLRDQFDPSRWAAFDALAPLKSLSTTVSSLSIGTSQAGAVLPLPETVDIVTSPSESKAKNRERDSSRTLSESLRLSEAPQSPSHALDPPDRYQTLSGSAPSTPTSSDAAHPPPVKTKRSLANIFSRKKSSSPLPSPSNG